MKNDVDKIREAFENIDYDFIGTLPEQFAFQWFSKGYKSQQAEIERLKAENEAMRCCENCKIKRVDCYQVLDCGVPDKYKLWQPKDNN